MQSIAYTKRKINLRGIAVKNRLIVGLSIIIFALAFTLRAYGLSSTPDIFGDEILYTNLATTLPHYGHLVAFGSPWFAHPPLFFATQSVFLQLTGVYSANLASVFVARATSCLYASLSVVVVFLLVTKMGGITVGGLTAFLLTVEPEALKYSRIGVLESAVIFLVILALYFFYRANTKPNNLTSYVVGGVFFGLALLVKEVAVYLLVIVAVWLLISRYINKLKVNTKGVIAFILTGLAMYSGYVIWALNVDASAFLGTNYYLIERALWIVRDTGYTAPTALVPIFSDITGAASIYLISYILIALAIVSSAYLLLKERNRSTSMLASWFIGSALFFAGIGTHNSQFFVYIIVPATVIAGYTLAKFALEVDRRFRYSNVVIVLIFTMIFYNVGVWVVVDGGKDNALSQSVYWIQENIPHGATIWVDYTFQYLLDDYKIASLQGHNLGECKSDLNVIRGQNINYFIFSPRWGSTADLLIRDYAVERGQLVAQFKGQSLISVDVYYVPNAI
jgi:4-amino-4-deoxy-L-arabinose transferase-like glycosyltransferase